MERYKKCSFCNALITDCDSFCSNCGTPIPLTEAEVNKTTNKKLWECSECATRTICKKFQKIKYK